MPSPTYTDIPAAGTKLSVKISGTFTEILGLSEISWDGLKRAVRNPNYLSRPTVPKRPGQTDLGQIKAKLLFDPNDAVHQALQARLFLTAAQQAAAMDDFKLEYADGLTTPANVAIHGFVSELPTQSGEVETGTWSGDLTIEVDTATPTPGASS